MNGEAFAVFICVFAAVGAFLFGLQIGYIGPILECASFKRDVAHLENWSDHHSRIDDLTTGFIVGSFSIGAILSSLPPVSGYFLEEWGRRSSIVLGSGVFLLGAVVQAQASSIGMMVGGRFVSGLSIGLLSTVVAIYTTELAPAGLRGSMTSVKQVMVTFGILVAAFIELAVLKEHDGWRWAIWLQCIPAAGLLTVMPMLPRSPRWLVNQGRRDEALESLYMVRSNPAEARKELQDIIDNFEEVKSFGEFRWSDLLEDHTFRLLMLGMGLQMLQQLVGMNALMYFGPRIFLEAGKDPNLFQTYMNLVNFVSTFLAVFLVDHYGRRPLLAVSAAGMLISCLTIGSAGTFASSDTGGTWIVFAAFFFVVNFAYGWGPIVWVYTAEMFPSRVRSYCVSTTTCTNWVGNFLIAQFTPVLLTLFSFKTFFIFAVFCVISIVLSLWLPETRGLTLETLDDVFRQRFQETGFLAGPPTKRSSYGSCTQPLEAAPKAVA